MESQEEHLMKALARRQGQPAKTMSIAKIELLLLSALK